MAGLVGGCGRPTGQAPCWIETSLGLGQVHVVLDCSEGSNVLGKDKIAMWPARRYDYHSQQSPMTPGHSLMRLFPAL